MSQDTKAGEGHSKGSRLGTGPVLLWGPFQPQIMWLESSMGAWEWVRRVRRLVMDLPTFQNGLNFSGLVGESPMLHASCPTSSPQPGLF